MHVYIVCSLKLHREGLFWSVHVSRGYIESSPDLLPMGLRIDNRRYGPFWRRCGILDTIMSLWGSNTCIIYISLAFFKAF